MPQFVFPTRQFVVDFLIIFLFLLGLLLLLFLISDFLNASLGPIDTSQKRTC